MVKLLSVAVSAKVKLMFRASVVVTVLPTSYASCSVTESGFATHVEIWLDELRHIPVEPVLVPSVGI